MKNSSNLCGKGLRAAWDDASFGAVSDVPEDIEKLRQIFNQFKEKNIIFMPSGDCHMFDNPGLVIGIASAIPKETLKLWLDFDKEQHKIRKEFDATGIEKLLREKGKGYFALSPRRDKDGSLVFWLNPMHQRENNFGYFKLEDLREWAEGKGKIPMKKEPQPASK